MSVVTVNSVLHPNAFWLCWYSFHLINVVPATPVSDVCAVYDMVNEDLQIIESTWNEVVIPCKIVIVKSTYV